MASSSSLVKTAATGILQSSLSPKYLHTNSTSHTWPFSAIAELIDNAYDPDVKASQLWIDKIRIHGEICLTFTDNGNGMLPDKLHKMLSFGFCEKVADGSHMPVGHYGNGFKSGSMRLGKDALVLTKQEHSRSIGYLSQTYLKVIKAETVVVPLATWDKNEDNYILRPSGQNALKDIYSHSLIRNEEELNSEFEKIVGNHGTRIIISNIRKTSDKKPEFDFETDVHDIRIPDDSSSEGEIYRKTKRQNHVPECDYSLRAYCAILYLKPKMQIILREKKVKTLVVEKSLSKTEVDRYKPTHAITAPVKVVFGFNSQNKNHYGIMMYHRNRLIKPYERVGYQLRANNLGVGVVGVVQCDFLQPTHNKQDFDYTKAYRACIYSLGVKLNEYWNEKKGPVKSLSSTATEQQIPVPQEVQALPDQTWAQCDEPTCLKWRKLPDGIDPASLPEKWYCVMNPDANFKSCDVPEERDDEAINITPYAKVQKKRLVKEMEEKQKREKDAKLAAILEQEEKRKILEKKEELLKKKEELLNLQIAQLEKDVKPKVKVENGSLPTAQVAPRPTAKPLNAVTPTAKTSPRRIGSQLAARLNQSAVRTPQTNQSKTTPAKTTRSATQSNQTTKVIAPPRSQTTPKRPLINQSASKPVATNQSVRIVTSTSQAPRTTPNQVLVSRLGQVTKNAPKQNVLLQTKPQIGQPLKLVATQTQNLGLTFKMVKTANGNTYLVQEKAKTTTVPKILTKPAGNDVKPLVNVLPKPQISTDENAATAKQQNSSSKPNATKTVAKSVANVEVKPSLSLAATAYSEITGNTSTTPQDVKNILAAGIKREASDSLASPPPAKVQRKKSDSAAVIVIDPLPPATHPPKAAGIGAEKRLKELESQVKALEKELADVKSSGKEKMENLVGQLNEKSALLIKRNKDVEAKEQEVRSKETELKEKTKQLKVLRENVCKLLQVLVPEIDVESEGGEETIDDLLKQVLEANK